MSQIPSQNGASGHPKSQKIKKAEHSKEHQKNNTQNVGFGMENDFQKNNPLARKS